MIEVSPSTLWLTTKVGPYWNLVSYNVTSRSFAFLTPPSISQRGGFSLAANGLGGGLVAFYPYGGMLYSPYFYTDGSNVNWKTGQLPVGLLPIRHAVVDTGSDIVAAVRDTRGKEAILYGPLGGSTTSTATYPLSGFQIAGLYARGSDVIVDLVQGDRHTLELFNVALRTWKTLVSVTTPQLRIAEAFTGSVASPTSLKTVACVISSRSSHQVRLETLAASGQAAISTLKISGTLSSCGISSATENYVTVNSGHSAVQVGVAPGGSATHTTLASTYLAPTATATVNGTLIAYKLTSSGTLLLYRDGSSTSVAGPINVYLQRVLKQAESGGVG
jgi:hypothetical protein